MFGLKKLARIKEISDYINGQDYAWNRCLEKYTEYVDLDIWGIIPEKDDMVEIFAFNNVTTIPFDLPANRSMHFVRGVNDYMSDLYERINNVSS